MSEKDPEAVFFLFPDEMFYAGRSEEHTSKPYPCRGGIMCRGLFVYDNHFILPSRFSLLH